MSSIKSILAVFVVAAIVGIVPQAFAANPTMEVTMAGSSALWQTAAVAAFNNGVSLVGKTPTCHYTSNGNKVGLIDSRPSLISGTNNTDLGTIWIVWDIASGQTCPGTAALHVWSDNKVDSIVGDRCFFAQPQCTEIQTDTTWTVGNKINFPGTPWGNNTDTVPPANVQTVFTGGAGTLNELGAAATDVRVEDGQFGLCRALSTLGANTSASGNNSSDNLDGLGYGTLPAGECSQPPYPDTLAHLVGTPIKSGILPTTGATANPLAFNISGNDPFSNTVIPAYKQINVGGEPVVFVSGRQNSMKGVHYASAQQLSEVFSGTTCNSSVFGFQAATPGHLNVFLREPLSGTMNTAEMTTFRRPSTSKHDGSATTVLGLSQETGVNATNPLSTVCAGGGGHRYRGIGTGEVVQGVQTSNTAFPDTVDGIAYTFFSYGNVSPLKDSANYQYLALHGYDPIFASYGNQPSGAPFDPGQPADIAGVGGGTVPGAADLPGLCGGQFPCSEDIIWAPVPSIESTTHTALSFPNVRLGVYPAWSILRVVAYPSGTGHLNQYAALNTLILNSNKYAVAYVPDYIPFAAVAVQDNVPLKNGTHNVPADPGMKVLRSHYQQYDGSGNTIGGAAQNVSTTVCGTSLGESGGDVGGSILNLLTTGIPKQECVIQNIQGPGGFQVRP